ncbi:MAG: hypothetical protein HS122_01130 [Opitutaceae bacterium]|nr:hypothetical protein [Opitutaceae bacterium]
MSADAQNAFMTATDVIHQLQILPPQELSKVRDWLAEQDEESPELLAAIDQGLHSLESKGARATTREELENKVRRWAGKSR